MGTYSDLRIGKFPLESSGNFNTTTHHSIFLPSDSKFVERSYDNEVTTVEVFQAPLRSLVNRLELLGSKLPEIKKSFESPYVTYDEPHDISFDEALSLVRETDLTSIPEYNDNLDFDRAEYAILPSAYQKRLDDPLSHQFMRGPGWDMTALMDRLSPYDTLRVLAERRENLDLMVVWDFMDVVESGYFERKDFTVGAGGQGYLLVTEGTSDTNIIRHAFKILRPEIADFFQFVDMEKNYPFSGHGQLENFMMGLKSIGKSDGVIAIFDNDIAGISSLNKLSKIGGINAIKLPDLDEFKCFPTIGPDGEHLADINGRAAAIECYLELPPNCRIRWNNYDRNAGAYQGAIDQTQTQKTTQQAIFLKTKSGDEYPFTRLRTH